MLKKLLKLYFKITGWKIVNDFPSDIKKGILLFAPHTSYSDFKIGRITFYIYGTNIKFLIKKEVFVFPFNFLIKMLGGIPVDRKNNKNLTEKIAEKLIKSDDLIIMIAPEGTRKPAKRWRKGFYQMALKANVPIILSFIDYKKKECGILDIIYPTGDYEKDLEKIISYYKDISPKYPQNFILPEIK